VDTKALACNRFNVIIKNEGGDYTPGQWG